LARFDPAHVMLFDAKSATGVRQRQLTRNGTNSRLRCYLYNRN